MNIRKNREIAAKGRALRKEAEKLREEGYSNSDIANKLCTNDDLVERMIGPEKITEDMTIWFPGTYNGRKGYYAKTIAEMPENRIIGLVQKRAREDAQWAIDNGHVGENNENEPEMRAMEEWVSRRGNIVQALEHIDKDGLQTERTVDWLCRDMANAAKWIAGGNASD